MIPKLDTVPEGKTEQSKLGGQWTFPFIQMANAVIVKSIMPNRNTLNYSNSAIISIYAWSVFLFKILDIKVR